MCILLVSLDHQKRMKENESQGFTIRRSRSFLGDSIQQAYTVPFVPLEMNVRVRPTIGSVHANNWERLPLDMGEPTRHNRRPMRVIFARFDNRIRR